MNACHTRPPATLQCIRATMQIVCENAASTNVNIAANAITAGVFVIHAWRRRSAIAVAATHLCWSIARCADSESRFLAIKKFSCPPASRLIGARQNRFFERIADTDSRRLFRFARRAANMVNQVCTLAWATRWRCDAAPASPHSGVFRCRAWTSGDR